MLMIAEILLTIRAWKKGWRVRALLPMGIALGVCIFMGAAAGASGGSADDLLGLALLIELLGVVALIVRFLSECLDSLRSMSPARGPVSKKACINSGAFAICRIF